MPNFHQIDLPKPQWSSQSILTDELAAFRAIIARGPATIVDGGCTECGRDYSDDLAITRCLSDDCPSHWECAGVPHPEFAA